MALLSTKTGLPSFSAQDASIVNYFTDPGFERGTTGQLPTGWSQYNDGAVAVPVDGTGGSAVSQVTMLVSNSSPIRGTLSAVITKDANNRQGVGYSFPFTISNPDKGVTAGVNFELVTSANYVAGDMVFYIYDVTNSTLITPRSVSLPALPSYGKFFSDYGLTAGTSYRFILHIATTSALAYTVSLDTMVNTTTRVAVPGAPIGNPITFTPTFTGVTMSTASATYTRMGQYAFIEYEGTASANATAAVIFDASSIFTGATIDAAVWAGTTRKVPGASGYIGATNSYTTSMTYQGTGGTFQFRINGTSSNLDNTAPATEAGVKTGGRLSFSILIPISQWAGSGTNMGPGASVEYASGAITSDANTTTTIFGQSGSRVPTVVLTNQRYAEITWQNPRQNGDLFLVDIDYNGDGRWLPHDNNDYGNLGYVYQNTNGYGISLTHTATTTRVNFSVYAYPSGATYGAAGTGWSSLASTVRWRIRKVNPTTPVGQVLASTDGREGLYKPGQAPGAISGTAIGAGYIGEKLEVTQTTPTNFPTSAQYGDLGSLPLTPGGWRIDYMVVASLNGSTTTACACAIGLVSGNSSSGVASGTTQMGFLPPVSASNSGGAVPGYIINISANTTYYAKVFAIYSAGNPQYVGRMTATRIA